MGAMILYDLAGAEDDRRFSPHCWRIKMALLHKGLEFETVPWRFVEKDAIAFSGQGLVPVLVHGDRVISDSWQIALHLDEAFPDRPMLMDSEQARGAIWAFKFWSKRALHPTLMRLIVLDILGHIHEKDRAYFRQSREKRLGMALEELAANPTQSLAAFRTALDPVRPVLAQQPYLGGSGPSFADFILFGVFQWARCVSPVRLLEPDDPVFAWRERLLAAYGELARNARGYPVWA